MLNYHLSIDHANQQYLNIKIEFDTPDDVFGFNLPSWRPGRYELGNFAKNVKALKVFDDKNTCLAAVKQTKDSWLVNTTQTKKIRIEYSYYASELNAGSTFLSAEQLYVNPVNCFLYSDSYFNEEIAVHLHIPGSWKIACALPKRDRVLVAKNFDELADSPFICSPNLQHASYESGNCVFHLWFNGEVKPDWERMLKDFKAFSDKQIEKFMEFPVNTYHFLIHVLPYKAYHGVEHTTSTVITIGPSTELFQGYYKELLGVSSHELYHTWNVKTIRPIEMQPYDFSKENYSRLGYLCEGVTTYMGDLFLLKSGVFTLNQYLDELKAQLQKHFDNPGRFNYSVAASSFDTWLDGYTPGAPGRKVSIYTEGCLLAFVKDVLLIQSTNGKYGMDEVMKRLYYDFALKGIGVSESDYKKQLETVAGVSFDDFFENFINGSQPYESILADAFEAVGIEFIHRPSKSYASGKLGFKYIPNGSNTLVSSIYAGSPADLGGMMTGDEILAINGYICNLEIDKWFNYFDSDQKVLTIARAGKLITLELPEVNRFFYAEYDLKPFTELTHSQRKVQEKWMH
jgi:predicted metalloprotease with PDZ domain